MDVLARWLVQQPMHILCVALAVAILWALLRRLPQRARRANGPLVAALGWLGYAGWEWWVLVKTPQADIRVDLLAIWPLLAILTLWAIIRIAFAPKSSTPRKDE